LSQTPTLKQILDALKKQVLVGRTYRDTARGLLKADPVLLQTAPTFFGMAIDGSLELAQMAVARLSVRSKLTLPDLERGFKDTEEIVLKMSSLYEGTVGELKYIGGDDYEVALDWIRRAKCAFIEKYEHEFKEKWDGPRPKDCSRKDWEQQ